MSEVNSWISVNDSLPQFHGEYLVIYRKDFGEFLWYFRDVAHYWPGERWRINSDVHDGDVVFWTRLEPMPREFRDGFIRARRDEHCGRG